MAAYKSKNHPYTLCWDCAKATGGCAWSKKLQPIAGWNAKQTKILAAGYSMQSIEQDGTQSSYLVVDCPEFERDGIYGGTQRLEASAHE